MRMLQIVHIKMWQRILVFMLSHCLCDGLHVGEDTKESDLLTLSTLVLLMEVSGVLGPPVSCSP